MKEYDLYLFDFDGTLFDSKPSMFPIFARGFGVAGVNVTKEEAEEWMHHSLTESMTMAGIPEEKWQEVADEILIALDDPEMLALITPFEDAKQTILALLSKGKKVGIVSNNDSNHIRLALSMHGFDMKLHTIMGSDRFEKGKPNPDPIYAALAETGDVPSNSVVYVGDSLQDVECGNAAGVDAILLDREDSYPDFKGQKIFGLKSLLF